jgi:hypothetical protein
LCDLRARAKKKTPKVELRAWGLQQAPQGHVALLVFLSLHGGGGGGQPGLVGDAGLSEFVGLGEHGKAAQEAEQRPPENAMKLKASTSTRTTDQQQNH